MADYRADAATLEQLMALALSEEPADRQPAASIDRFNQGLPILERAALARGEKPSTDREAGRSR